MPLSCIDNNYMTYNWRNSAYFSMQEYANQENCGQYSCILFFFFYKLEPRIWRRENLSLNRVNFTIDNNKWKCTRAHVQEDKSIKLSIYFSIRHFEVGWETGSRWLSKCIVGLLWGTNLPPCWKFVPQSSNTMHFETISTQSPAQPQSGQYENLFENGFCNPFLWVLIKTYRVSWFI